MNALLIGIRLNEMRARMIRVVKPSVDGEHVAILSEGEQLIRMSCGSF
jgi:hypothetical protein